MKFLLKKGRANWQFALTPSCGLSGKQGKLPVCHTLGPSFSSFQSVSTRPEVSCGESTAKKRRARWIFRSFLRPLRLFVVPSHFSGFDGVNLGQVSGDAVPFLAFKIGRASCRQSVCI